MSDSRYTSASEIRTQVVSAAEARAAVAEKTGGRKPDPQVIERWIEQRVEASRKNGRLVTNQQLADWRARRWLKIGDTARYIGDPRNETIQIDGDNVTYTRPNGQEGTIIDVQRDGAGSADIVTFMPTPNAALKDELVVKLVVRRGTAGYMDLERVP